MSDDSFSTQYFAIDAISLIADFGISSVKLESTFTGSLYSAILNESVHTNTIFLESHSTFVFRSTHVKTGEKLFSTIVYSTIFTQAINV
jgi:hypothetical protein